MATSGAKNFSVTRNQIIYAAMKKAGVYQTGEIPSAEEVADASFALNVMVKEWTVKGVDVPWREEITVFVQPGRQSYSLGPAGDHVTHDYIETTLSVAASAADTTIALALTSGMTAADHIGIKLDDGSIHWSTIVTVGTTLISSGLPSAASEGNAVYVYTNKANRPQRILWAYRRDTNGIDTPVTLIGEEAYRLLANKSASGPVNQIHYQATLDNGTLFVWPTSGSDKLVLISQTLIDDFNAANNNPQLPVEWSNALIWGLAADIGTEYGMTLKDVFGLKSLADEKLATLLDYDVENASVIFGRE
jgi:hypothetical protein